MAHGAAQGGPAATGAKVFWFFFSKKNRLLDRYGYGA
jgi:hypothetical protein